MGDIKISSTSFEYEGNNMIMRLSVLIETVHYINEVGIHSTFNKWKDVNYFKGYYVKFISDNIHEWFIDVSLNKPLLNDDDIYSYCQIEFAIYYKNRSGDIVWNNNNNANFKINICKYIEENEIFIRQRKIHFE